jgi:hypothetical protein
MKKRPKPKKKCPISDLGPPWFRGPRAAAPPALLQGRAGALIQCGKICILVIMGEAFLLQGANASFILNAI